MAYYTATDLVNMKLMADAAKVDSDMINNLINTDRLSQLKSNMAEGEKYYRGEHDYLKHKNYYYSGDNTKHEMFSRANNLIPIPFFTLGANQKRNYMIGKSPTISVNMPEVIDEENPSKAEQQSIAQQQEFEKLLTGELGKKFVNTLGKCVIGATTKVIEWLHFYIDQGVKDENGETIENGRLRMVITPSQQIIPIYDMQYEDKLIAIIRYYTYQIISGKDILTRYKVEWWDDKKVTYWEQSADESWHLDLNYKVNPYAHWYVANTSSGQKKAHSWGKVPFVPIYNNQQMTNDLQLIKPLIDAYDKVFSGWANDLEDIKQLILVLKGYTGLKDQTKEGLSELEYFLENLYGYGAIPLEPDGEVNNLKNEIPVDARERFLKLCKDAIHEIGQIVDVSKVGDGSITNVVIKSRYAGLDMRVNDMISTLEESIEEIMWFVVTWINFRYNKKFDYKQVNFTFNKSQIFNEKELVETVNLIADRIDEQTFLENIPFIKNPQEVIKRKESERKKREEETIIKLDNVPDEEETPDLEAESE